MARRFTVDGSLSDRARSGRPFRVMTPVVVGRIKRLARAKQGRRSQSTRRVAATLSSRGTLISQTSVRRALHSDGVKPYVQPQVPLQRYGDKQRRLRVCVREVVDIVHADEDYIGDLPDRVHSTPIKHKQIAKTGALLLAHLVHTYIDIHRHT